MLCIFMSFWVFLKMRDLPVANLVVVWLFFLFNDLLGKQRLHSFKTLTGFNFFFFFFWFLNSGMEFDF